MAIGRTSGGQEHAVVMGFQDRYFKSSNQFATEKPIESQNEDYISSSSHSVRITARRVLLNFSGKIANHSV